MIEEKQTSGNFREKLSGGCQSGEPGSPARHDCMLTLGDIIGRLEHKRQSDENHESVVYELWRPPSWRSRPLIKLTRSASAILIGCLIWSGSCGINA